MIIIVVIIIINVFQIVLNLIFKSLLKFLFHVKSNKLFKFENLNENVSNIYKNNVLRVYKSTI